MQKASKQLLKIVEYNCTGVVVYWATPWLYIKKCFDQECFSKFTVTDHFNL